MATFTKLKNGSWGITGSASEVREGAKITVRKKSGETKTVTVVKVVWSGNGKAIAAISEGSQQRGNRYGSMRIGGRGHEDCCGNCGAPNPSQSSWCSHCNSCAD